MFSNVLTTVPRLRIRRPSPTTTEFTVTTLPPQTIGIRALRLVLLLLRITLSLATAFLLYSRWATSPLAFGRPIYPVPRPQGFFSGPGTWLWWLLDEANRSSTGAAFAEIATAIPLPVLLPVAVTILYGLSLRVHTTESLLVMRGLGVQTSESSKSYFAGTATRFIPTEKIQDILVNEGFRGFEVRYYLIVVVEGEEDVVVVFPGLLPKRAIVEAVWRRARACLYEGKTTDEKAN